MRLFRSVIFVSFVFAQLALAEAPEFKVESTRKSFYPGEPIQISLKSYLKDQDVPTTIGVDGTPDGFTYDPATTILSAPAQTKIAQKIVGVWAVANRKKDTFKLWVTIDRKPQWKLASKDLGTVLRGAKYEWKAEQYLNDPDKTAPKITLENAPAWITYDKARRVVLATVPKDETKPASFDLVLEKDLGKMSFHVALETKAPAAAPAAPTKPPAKPPAPVSDKGPLRDLTHMPREVLATAPRFTEETLKFEDLIVGKAFNYELKDKLEYTGTGTITYSYAKAPPGSWLTLDPATGKLSGLPTKAEKFIAVVEASDGPTVATVVLNFQVFAEKVPPRIKDAELKDFRMKERATLEIPLATHVVSDAPPLTFRMLTPITWFELKDGVLKLTPRFAQLGTKLLPFEVTDSNGLKDAGEIRVVVEADPAPPQWPAKSPRIEAFIGDGSWNAALAPYVTSVDDRKVTFRLGTNVPTWLKIRADGLLFGVPVGPAREVEADVVAVTESFESPKTITLVLTQGNRSPQWALAELTLKNARVGDSYNGSVADPTWVSDPDGDGITFTKTGADWLTMEADGTFKGVPPASAMGNAQISVTATDSKGLSSSPIVAKFKVQGPNKPPKWSDEAGAFSLGQNQVGKSRSYGLLDKVKDPEEDTLTFKIESGPAWVSLDASGTQLVVAPGAASKLGPFNVRVSASDGGRQKPEGAFVGIVVPTNKPPVLAGVLSVKMKERTSNNWDLAATKKISDPDGDPLRYRLEDTNTGWTSITPKGVLSLKPKFAQIGTHTVKVIVTDEKDELPVDVEVIVERSPRPPRWIDEVRVFAKAGVPLSESIAGHAEDLDKLPITFGRTAFGPKWLTVGADGMLSGTPGEENVGENYFIPTAGNGDMVAEGSLIIKVQSDNHPPVWKNVTMKVAKVGQSYFQPLASFVDDADEQEFLRFGVAFNEAGTRLAPDWLDIANGGQVFGIPSDGDVGTNEFTVRVTDSRGAFAEKRIRFEVDSKNNRPIWTLEPGEVILKLGNTRVGETLNYDLNAKASDPDGDVLDFELVEGPPWLNIPTDGRISFKAEAGHVGQYPLKIRASDRKSFADIEATWSVGEIAVKPIVHKDALVFTAVPGREMTIQLRDPKYVEDPMDQTGQSLKFEKDDFLDWMTITETGALTLRPPATLTEEGQGTFKVTGKGGLSESGFFVVKLEKPTITPPEWLTDKVEVAGQVGVELAFSLKSHITNPSPAFQLQFKKLAGDDWLKVSDDGAVSGKPPSAGLKVFQVAAAYGPNDAPVSTVMEITVSGVTSEPLWYSFKEQKQNVPLEILFVLDNGTKSADFYRRLKKDAPAFFEKLDKVDMNYTVAVMSAYDFLGQPMKPPTGIRSYLAGGNKYLNEDFSALVDKARPSASDGFRSPIHALDRLFVGLKRTSGLYGNGYYSSGVPLMVIVYSGGKDQFRVINKAKKDMTVENIAAEYVAFHAALRKPFQLYWVDRTCDKATIDEMARFSHATGAYALEPDKCEAPFDTGLVELAQTAIDEAGKFERKGFALKAKPADANRLKVWLEHKRDGKEIVQKLSGGTGKDSDQWYYDPDSETGAVYLNWWNIQTPDFDRQTSLLKISE